MDAGKRQRNPKDNISCHFKKVIYWGRRVLSIIPLLKTLSEHYEVKILIIQRLDSSQSKGNYKLGNLKFISRIRIYQTYPLRSSKTFISLL